MKHRSSVVFLVAIGLLVLAGAVGWGSQRMQAHALRTELERVQTQAGELEWLKAENARLRAQQVSAEELTRLRADHEALPRLRAEVESVRARVEVSGR